MLKHFYLFLCFWCSSEWAWSLLIRWSITFDLRFILSAYFNLVVFDTHNEYLCLCQLTLKIIENFNREIKDCLELLDFKI